MMDTQNTINTAVDDDVMLPEGWDGQADIFAGESTGESLETTPDQPQRPAPTPGPDAGEPAPTPGQDVDTEQAEALPPTTGGVPEAAGAEPSAQAKAPTPGPDAGAGHKLRFAVKVDRNDMDVEIDERELPTLYQKAQVVDRVQARLQRLEPMAEQAERLARTLGYEDWADMLKHAEQGFRQTETARLVGQGVNQEVAAEIAEAKLLRNRERANARSATESPVLPAGTPEGERDFGSEVRALLEERPEIMARGKLPDEVIQACARDGTSVRQAYAEWEARQRSEQDRQRDEELTRLRRENEVLRQNADSAARAPVTGSTGGAADKEAKDDFLMGFEAY